MSQKPRLLALKDNGEEKFYIHICWLFVSFGVLILSDNWDFNLCIFEMDGILTFSFIKKQPNEDTVMWINSP